MKKQFLTTLAIFVLLASVGLVLAGTTVPGHQKKIDNQIIDEDGNGYSDAGVYVNGHYTSVYAYDVNGDYYWDLGDGRVYSTVPSIDDLDQETLTVCDYVINYRADFGNDPFMNTGWIQNHIKCSGYDDNNHYNYLIAHEDDKKFKGNGVPVWGTWEYTGLIQSHIGNTIKNNRI